MTRRTNKTRRAGFTLVELLVVMALITLIMSILSEAFVQGLESVRTLKAIGDLQERLRTGIVPLRDDLLRRHFLGSEKLGVSYDTPGLRPTMGFFRIQQGRPHSPNFTTNFFEGYDGDGLPSYRVALAQPSLPSPRQQPESYTQWSDVLHLTVANVGTRRSDYLTALAPPVASQMQPNPSDQLWAASGQNAAEPYDYRQNGTYISQWAEVMWSLTPMIDTDTGLPMTAGPSSTPLFNLHRRQKLLLTANAAGLNGTNRIASNNLGQFPEIACKPDATGALYFTTPTDSVQPGFRSMMDMTGIVSWPHAMGTPYPPNSYGSAIGAPAENSAMRGDDRVITDVVSFEIKVLMPGQFQFEDIWSVQARLGLPQNGIYDTATWPPSQKLTIKAVQIVLRVWDERTQQTRQITMIQDM